MQQYVHDANNRPFTLPKIQNSVRLNFPQKKTPSTKVIPELLKKKLDFTWRRLDPRTKSRSYDEHLQLKTSMAHVLLGLTKLNAEVVFVDEFRISNYTHKNYGWQKSGTHTGLPLAGYQQSYNCIAAVTEKRLVHFWI